MLGWPCGSWVGAEQCQVLSFGQQQLPSVTQITVPAAPAAAGVSQRERGLPWPAFPTASSFPCVGPRSLLGPCSGAHGAALRQQLFL